jgi:hypothetical protein
MNVFNLGIPTNVEAVSAGTFFLYPSTGRLMIKFSAPSWQSGIKEGAIDLSGLLDHERGSPFATQLVNLGGTIFAYPGATVFPSPIVTDLHSGLPNDSSEMPGGTLVIDSERTAILIWADGDAFFVDLASGIVIDRVADTRVRVARWQIGVEMRGEWFTLLAMVPRQA